MRILVATDAWRPQVNGVVRSLESVAEAAAGLGATLDFVTPQDFSCVPMPGYREIALALASPRALRRRLAEGYDHVHIATEGPIGLAARAVCLRDGRPFTTSFHTRFPEYIHARTGLPVAWGYAALDTACLVYPQPAPPGVPLPAAVPDARQHGHHATGGDEDFSGLREYRSGDSMRRIDWKASAREQGMYTKLFEGQGQFVLWLDYDHAPGRDSENKLSLLTRWVLDAHAGQHVWGLRLPGEAIAPASGEAHQQACLRALAVFGLKERPL